VPPHRAAGLDRHPGAHRGRQHLVAVLAHKALLLFVCEMSKLIGAACTCSHLKQQSSVYLPRYGCKLFARGRYHARERLEKHVRMCIFTIQ
jgi:hypothetical protein